MHNRLFQVSDFFQWSVFGVCFDCEHAIIHADLPWYISSSCRISYTRCYVVVTSKLVLTRLWCHDDNRKVMILPSGLLIIDYLLVWSSLWLILYTLQIRSKYLILRCFDLILAFWCHLDAGGGGWGEQWQLSGFLFID